jgi:hypothetical protein
MEGDVMNRFLYTRFGQWLSILFSGWCLIRKDDPRFVVTHDDYVLRYDGDPSAVPDKGISNQRNAWKDWVTFRISPDAYYSRFVVIDTYAGQRMACFKKSKSRAFAIRAGYEAGTIRIGTRAGNYASGDNELRPQFLVRWRDDQPWSLNIPKQDVLFI